MHLLPLNIHIPDNDATICSTRDKLPSVMGIGERLNFITAEHIQKIEL